MKFVELVPHVFQLTHRNSNVFLLQCLGWTLIGAGTESAENTVLESLGDLGLRPQDLGRILLTHSHPEQAGSAASLQRKTRAQVLCHQADGQLLENGIAVRSNFQASPGPMDKIVYDTVLSKRKRQVQAVDVDRYLSHDEVVTGGFRVLHTPGYTAGHLSFLWRYTLFVGNAACNLNGIRPPSGCEDYAQSLESLDLLSRLDFKNVCFGQGDAIIGNARERFRDRPPQGHRN